MFKRNKKRQEEKERAVAEEREGLAQVEDDVEASEPLFGGAAVDNHAHDGEPDATGVFEGVPDSLSEEPDGQGREPAAKDADAETARAEAPDASNGQPIDEAAEDARSADDVQPGESSEKRDEHDRIADEGADATIAERSEGSAEIPEADEVGGTSRGNYDFAADEGNFPAPRAFDVAADAVPVREDDREGVDALPTDGDEAFEPEGEEFVVDSDSFVDDNQTDYYEYGDKMHGVRTDIIADASPSASTGGRGAKHRKLTRKEQKLQREAEMPEHQRRSRKMRRVLIIVVLLLIVLLGMLAYWGYQLFKTSQDIAVQQINRTQVETSAVTSGANPTEGANSQNQKVTEVPVLTSLLGKTQDQAVTEIGHGAVATAVPVTDGTGAQTGANVTVMLTDEPSDNKSHTTPTVYLVLDAGGLVTQAGYSAATASLGYGSLSFEDAVKTEHVVEKTLNEAGLAVDNGTVSLPDKSTYTTYATDGKTRVSEKCSFDGASTASSVAYKWSAVLSYDYTAANASGNLADTVRQITIYVSRA